MADAACQFAGLHTGPDVTGLEAAATRKLTKGPTHRRSVASGGPAASRAGLDLVAFFSTTDFSRMTTPALVVTGDKDASPV